jgi:hypothetical protein
MCITAFDSDGDFDVDRLPRIPAGLQRELIGAGSPDEKDDRGCWSPNNGWIRLEPTL